jgi:exosortase/archaeosortase family protein
MKTKKHIQYLILVLVITLMVLPFATSFNEALTKLVEGMFWYGWMQTYIVPYEARVLSGVLDLIPGVIVYPNIRGIELNGTQIYVTWNCIGWQSFVLLLVSIAAGLGKRFTISSQVQTLVFGICGMFLVNLLRLIITALLAVYLPSVFVLVFHNYLSAFLTIGFLIFFWWFSYSFILETKETNIS